ncbi:Discoidin domain-containing receptor 2 precursor-like protein [Sarcoptes scabiei]|uniref:Discoidin domain-containing receptor 2-like protein n=1 Tax=Sarcoptes scabiei TaxID=52283 RepID=A0A132AG21_SARSC|nr:Discoidin domain-containing receptor 2 precursor-like protein [Sarcoptes scabiei]
MQIAEAMHTLNQIGFTHRDLAARNCLIYSKTLKIKLSDTGAMNKSYKKEYFQETLPIRWMSFETIINGVCTTKSQVYSFGVTLWEIMKYCQMLPHQFLSDEELLNEIFNTENIDDDYCPEEIYDLILECTQRSEESRPDFPEIIYFLQKKIQGHR